MIKLIIFLFVLVSIAGFFMIKAFGPVSLNHGNMNHESHIEQLANDERQAEVSARSVDVMPFNLHDTKHYFVKNAEGGTQQVIAKLPDDVNQIRLVRNHLKEIREKFLQGDFSDPAHIHGNDMSGLRVLQESEPGQIEITYQDVSSGGELSYSTLNAELVTAIHAWFDAQVSDHGKDASAHHAVTSQETGQ